MNYEGLDDEEEVKLVLGDTENKNDNKNLVRNSKKKDKEEENVLRYN